MKDQLEAYTEFVRPYYATRDVAHTFSHIERIIRRLDKLAEGITVPVRRDRLYFLASFHGLGVRWHDDAEFREQATALLQRLGWSDSEIQELIQSLDRHLDEPETIEEEIVHDANKLETLGAFGIAKAFTMGGLLGQTYEETVDYFERHSLSVVFRTPAGRQLAAEGQTYAKEFLQRLRTEL